MRSFLTALFFAFALIEINISSPLGSPVSQESNGTESNSSSESLSANAAEYVQKSALVSSGNANDLPVSNPSLPGNVRVAIIQRPMNRKDAMRFLQHYGYLKSSDMNGTQATRRQAMALGRYQQRMHIPVTFHLDSKTVGEMKKPRCGYPDVDDKSDKSRRRRFSAQARWGKLSLTYRLRNTESRLGETATRRIIQRAFEVWSEHTPLRFTEVQNQADIDILFASRSHGDNEVFDGRGGILAHAFLPTGTRWSTLAGDVHFDSEEYWNEFSRYGVSLLLVAAHELGHSLGLGHSTDRDSLMEATYKYIPNFDTQGLPKDDIMGIQHLYGQNVISLPTTAPTTRLPFVPQTFRPQTIKPAPVPTSAPDPSSRWNYCRDPRVDAIATAPSGDRVTFAFRDNWYINLLENGVDKTFGDNGVRDINSLLQAQLGLRITKVNAAMFSSATRLRIYANRVEYNFDVRSRRLVFANTIRRIVRNDNLIAYMNDLFFHPYFRFIYAFQGNRYTRLQSLNDTTQPPPSGYPRDISVWNLPTDAIDMDAMDTWKNDRTYLFKGQQYYRLQERNVGIDSGYPKTIADVWFGC